MTPPVESVLPRDLSDVAPVILFVDDELGMLEVCRGFLADEPYRVITVEEPASALALLDDTPPDLVLADFSMSEMNGVDLLRRFLDASPRTVRVLFTGVTDMHIAEEALGEAEVFRFLVKPFGPETLRTTIRQGLEFQRLTEDNRRYRDEMEALVSAQSRDLQVAKEFTDRLLEALPVGVLTLEGGGVVTRANPAVGKVLGWTPDELVGRPLSAFGLPCGPGCEDGAGTNRGGHLEVEAPDRWGIPHTLLWSCALIHPDRGAEAGCVASFLDITEKKELETVVTAAKREIESVFDSITEPTFLVDRALKVVRANRAFIGLVGKPFQDVVGHPCRGLVEAALGPCEACPMGKVFDAGAPAQGTRKAADGRIFRIHHFPVLVKGSADYVVVRYQDVTAERELESRLLQSEKMASVGQLAAGIAHEVNNPIGFILSNLNRVEEYARDLEGISGTLGNLKSRVEEGSIEPGAAWEAFLEAARDSDLDFITEDVAAIVEECQDGADRIRKIVTDLKSFSHPGSKDWEYADLNRGVESTLNIVWNELKYKCEVVKNLGNLPTILCRPQQLNQVFMNLLVNAAQAIEERGTITITTRDRGDGHVEVTVADTGKGMPPDVVKRIFDPFFTTKPPGKGTGLGLHLSAGIVHTHQGEIRVDSTVGEGTVFTVVLPVEPEGVRDEPGQDV